MDKELTNKFGTLALVIVGLITFATLVSGYDIGGGFVISEVPIDSSQYGGEDYPNWTHGSLCPGVTYDAGIQMVSDTDLANVILQLRFLSDGIAASDVSVWYWTGSAWTIVVFAANDGISAGSFVIPGVALIADTPIIVPLLVVFNEIGSYTSQLWAEGV